MTANSDTFASTDEEDDIMPKYHLWDSILPDLGRSEELKREFPVVVSKRPYAREMQKEGNDRSFITTSVD